MAVPFSKDLMNGLQDGILMFSLICPLNETLTTQYTTLLASDLLSNLNRIF